MNARRYLSLQVCLWSLLALTGCAVTADATRPNILLILADDLGYADVGFNGAKDIVTPNLDALAAQGMTFSQAYLAHPFCGPSRAALMTGRYPHKIGAQFNLPTRGSFVGVPRNETFMSKTLQAAGYFTGAIGKWHLGEAPDYHPNRRGFDEFYGFLGGGHNYFPEQFEKEYAANVKQGRKNIFDYILPLEHNGQNVRETEYVTDGLSREAAKFVRAAATKDQPFFLYLAYNAPHVPLEATKDDLEKFADISDDKRRTYAAMVYAVDRGVGRVVEALRESGQLDNTLILFLSDNGGKLTEGANNYPLKEGKGSVYEGGFRSPMLMHWPGVIPAGEQFSHPVLALDLYPTFAGLAGAEIPARKKLDGKNIWQDILSRRNPRSGESFYALRHNKGFSNAAARRDQWKAVKYGDAPWQLFDVERDIGEQTNLSAQHPMLLQDIVRDMEKWSWDNIQPLWFHISEEGGQWREDSMPRFHETFRIEE